MTASMCIFFLGHMVVKRRLMLCTVRQPMSFGVVFRRKKVFLLTKSKLTTLSTNANMLCPVINYCPGECTLMCHNGHNDTNWFHFRVKVDAAHITHALVVILVKRNQALAWCP